MAKKLLSPEQKAELLSSLGVMIAGKREEAVSARSASGIEKVWQDCEEAYLCIDDSNRQDFNRQKWAKPTTSAGPLISESNRNNKQSSAFVRLTARYVDIGAAKVCEALLPVDDKAFSFGPTPVPDLVIRKRDKTPVVNPATGQPVMKVVEGQPPVPATVADAAEVELEIAKQKAEKAEKRIYDWQVECNRPAQIRKLVHDSSRIGVGVLKGPFPTRRDSQAAVKEGGIIRLKKQSKTVPAVEWKDPWNIFPDPACGENIHDGDYILERDFLSAYMLRQLKKDPTYIADRIDQVLKEGPEKCNEQGLNPAEKVNKDRYAVWYFYGCIKRSELALTNAVGQEDLPDDLEEVHVIVTLVNDSVVRATINPLQSGRFPYHVMPWSRRAGSWAGVGVAEQVSMPQRMVNAATRALLNNAGLSGGPQLIIDITGLYAADGRNDLIYPNKLWYRTADATNTNDDVRKMFMAVEIPNVGPQMMAIIEYAMKLAEEASNIPLISQGHNGQTTPDTFGAAEMQNSNANVLLRNIALSFDDHVTEPEVHQFYEWLLLDPNVPDDEKGDFQINAKGSIAMVEKIIQQQMIMQVLNMSANPAFDIKPREALAEFLKSNRLDPRKFQYSEEEKSQKQEQPQPPPQLLAAQINAQARVQAAEIAAQGRLAQDQQQFQLEQQAIDSGKKTPQMLAAESRVQAAMIDARSDMIWAQNEAQMAIDNDNANIRELQLKERLALLEYAARQKLTLEQVKVELAKTTMQEQTKRQLAAAQMQMRQPVETA